MVLSRLVTLTRTKNPSSTPINHYHQVVRSKTTSKSGSILQEPHTTSFGLLKLVLTVVPGLLIGAAISKNIANFLEENDLFVPSDDDDEDD